MASARPKAVGVRVSSGGRAQRAWGGDGVGARAIPDIATGLERSAGIKRPILQWEGRWGAGFILVMVEGLALDPRCGEGLVLFLVLDLKLYFPRVA